MKKILSVLLATITACGVCIVSGCTKSKETVFVPETSIGEFELGEQISNGISLTATTISPNDYATYGVSQVAENAFSLTASITPAEISNYVLLNWSVAWENPDSTWASGKTNMSEYIDVNGTDRGFNAVVACYQAFGERVKITVSVDGQEDLSASLYADYVKRPDSISLNYDSYGEQTAEKAEMVSSNYFSWFNGIAGPDGSSYRDNSSIFYNGKTEDSDAVGTKSATKVKYSVELSEAFVSALEDEGLTLMATSKDSTLLNVGEEFDCCIGLIGTQYFMEDPAATSLVNAFLFAQGKEDEVDAEITLTAELVDLYYAYKSAVATVWDANKYLATVNISLYNDAGTTCYATYCYHFAYIADEGQQLYLPDFLVESVTIDGDSNIVF